MKLSPVIRQAIKSGPVPDLRPVQDIIDDPQTLGEQVIAFAGRHLVVPTGMKRGEPLILEPFQCAFILAVFDNPDKTKEAILSVAARNGKTFVIAVIMLAYLIGPLAEKNIGLASGAMSREQAAHCFSLMEKILLESPDCEGRWAAVPSSKRVVGLSNNAEYRALSADAKTGYGGDYKVVLLDEAGQIRGPRSDFTDMLESRQGSHDDSIFFIVSTQAPSDMDYLSQRIDAAERTGNPQTVAHVYAADPDAELLDREAWEAANPGLGVFRSVEDLTKQMQAATDIPAKESGARNQFLNQRVAMEQLAIAPSVWKACDQPIDLEVFRRNRVVMGLDLSSRNDLTAAVLCAQDDDKIVHVLPFVFCPTSGILERARRDRAPYDLWVKEGHMLPIGGKTMDFDQIAFALGDELSKEGIQVDQVQFDKHLISHFQAACSREGILQDAEWVAVPQFFKDMGVRLVSLTGLLLERKLIHGGHPALTMSASVAIAKVGREGLAALDKSLSTHRIDPLVALVMAAWPYGDGEPESVEYDVTSWVA